MDTYRSLIERLDSSSAETFWFGPAPREEIQRLEELLGHPLPPSFRLFLQECGGGGEVETGVSGIYQSAAKDDKGTVWGDTRRCRERFDLPNTLVVIYFSEDEICWCLDCRRPEKNGESPVVSYNVFSRAVDRKLSPTFADWFGEYVDLRAADI